MKTRLSIRYLLLLANAFILLLPVFAVTFLHLWDGHLVRVTEQQLIAEALLIGETWREQQLASDPGRIDAPHREGLRPIDGVLSLDYQFAAPAAVPTHWAADRSGPAWVAGARIQALLQRARQANLGSLRVLDAQGCVVATTASDLGACLGDLPEVRQALDGNYAALTRARLPRAKFIQWAGLSRRSSVRVFMALPVREGSEVTGVVYLSRLSSSPLEAVWKLRFTVLAAALLCIAVTVAVSLFFSRRIARPVRAITASAEAMARGEPVGTLIPQGFAPAEVESLATALQRVTSQLSDRAKYISEFAATVSHELKTPLAGIKGAIELLRDSGEQMSPEQKQRFLANINADAERMDRLVSRLLQLARIQSAPETAEELALGPFCRGLAQRYGDQVRVDLRLAPERLTMQRDHLEMALRNLLDNAVRHGAGEPVDLSVAKFGDAQVAFQVHDRGAGISTGNRARVFERFFTTERDAGGTGLGLAIVRAVAETRGGSVSFESGQSGTTFTLIV